MIMIVLIALMIICGIGILFCTYKLHRNDRVLAFREKIIDMVYDSKAIGGYQCRRKILYKHSYDDMFNSFKPLKLEAWYTEEEIKMLKGGSK